MASERSRSFSATRRSFSLTNWAFLASKAFAWALSLSTSVSMSSILTLFLSRAFCAATLFFNFLRISFSSGDKWSKFALFLTGLLSLPSCMLLPSSLSVPYVLSPEDEGLFKFVLFSILLMLGLVSSMIFFRSLADMQPLTNMLCGMTIICCWFFADFAGCKLDGRIVIVFVAGLTPVVLSISVPIVFVCITVYFYLIQASRLFFVLGRNCLFSFLFLENNLF